MADSSRFDFCPKCGALARDGVCQSCGYRDPNYVAPVTQQSQYGQQMQYNQQSQYGQQAKYTQQPQYGQQAQYTQQSQYGQQTQYNQQAQYTQQSQYGQQTQYNQQAQYNQQSQYGQQAQYTQQPQYGQPNQYSQMGHPAYHVPEKKNGAVIGLIIAIAVLAVFLMVAVAFAAFFTLRNAGVFDKNYWDAFSEWEDDYREGENRNQHSDTKDSREEEIIVGEEETISQDVEGISEGKYYEELYNAVQYDLSYQVEMTEDFFSSEEYENVMVSVSYPQISGDVSNLDYINEVLEDEFLFFVDYFQEDYEPYMSQDSYYICLSEGFVTYMDEKVMSVVFKEQVVMDGFSMINFYCLNFNMKDGVLMNNTEILDIDSDFVVDFRRREILENGDEWLTDYTDEEILAMLKDPDDLVIFYTPMGMEVGLNMIDVVLYMTYADYEQFLNTY